MRCLPENISATFHNKYIISTSQIFLAVPQMRLSMSMIKNNGREIFQQERVDEDHRETGNELMDGAKETLNSVLIMEWRGIADAVRGTK
jgi:hypothetical protein